MDANRVGEEKEKAWVGGLESEVGALATGGSPRVEKSLDELRAQAAEKPQPLEKLSPIVEEEGKIERDLQMLVPRLTEFGDVNAVVQQLRELQRRQEEIRNRTRERVGEGSGEKEPAAPGAGDPAPPGGAPGRGEASSR